DHEVNRGRELRGATARIQFYEAFSNSVGFLYQQESGRAGLINALRLYEMKPRLLPPPASLQITA
ncbi:MAG: hypothetical protein L6Q76_24025, partial [Polyangiaceae bacterium]|nr:hypothetical protein [Polyangiaceae bacterium]